MGQDNSMLYFITDRTDHHPLVYKSRKIQVTDSLEALDNYLNAKVIGYDIETNGARLHTTDLLLVSLGDRNQQFVLDATAPLFLKVKEVLNDKLPKIVAIGHNIKFDYTHSKLNGIYLHRTMDTFLASQRLHLGRTEIKHSLEDVHPLYLKEIMNTDKSVRTEFLSMNRRSKFDIKHVLYSGTDISTLIDLAKVIKQQLVQRNQWDWFYEFENKLSIIVGDMELAGIACYVDKWRPVLDKAKKDRLLAERWMDEWLNNTKKFKIKQRNRATVVMPSLFGVDPVEIDNVNKRHINYNSSTQMLDIIRKLGEPVPLLKQKGKVTESVSEKALLPYLVERPDSPIKPLLKKYIDFKGYEKFISSYGLKFINTEVKKKGKGSEAGFVNPVTKKVHTSYKIIGADTGRFSSGDVKKGFFQSQNLPREKHIREAFGLTEEEIKAGYNITTCDLSGAELIIMAALADDQHLYEMGADKIIDGVKVEGDLHSPIATKCWRAIYEYRKRLGRNMTIYDSNNKEYTLTADFEITKSLNKPLRIDFKPMTFGVVYGLKAAKGGQTLNIPPDEAQIAIDVITNEFPRTIKMVEAASQVALADGYVEFNCISHNKRWFTEVVLVHERLKLADRAARYHATIAELPFKVLSEVESAARNCRIQGTQADMLKESKVRLVKFAKERNIDMQLLLTVHDELVVKHKGTEFASDIEEIMTTTANRYLEPYSSNIKMRAEASTGTTWTK